MTGLKIALQFAKLAINYLKAGDTAAASRNFRQAQKSYQEFLTFLPQAKLTPSEQEEVDRDLPQLRETLEGLAARLKIETTK